MSHAWGTTSWLDHILCTADAKQAISAMYVCYDCIQSDHHPMSFNITSDLVPEYSDNNNYNNSALRWTSISREEIEDYRVYTRNELAKIVIPESIKCTDPNCNDVLHRDSIDTLYRSIVSTLKGSRNTAMRSHARITMTYVYTTMVQYIYKTFKQDL